MTTTITAFNGIPVGGKPVILLHTYSQSPIQTTLVLVGAVSKLNKEGYGPRLDVTHPADRRRPGRDHRLPREDLQEVQLQGQAAQLRQRHLPTKKLKARGEFVFKDGESLTPELTGKCSQKPEAKKK